MANEISVVVTLQYTNVATGVGALARNLSGAFSISGARYVAGTQRLTTTPAAIDLNGITNVGFIWAKNLDPTNDVKLRSATGAADTITLKPGEACLYRSTTNTPSASSSASTVDMEYLLLEA